MRGRLKAVPFADMFDVSTRRMKVRKVDINSEDYEVGRKYMIRLDAEDFTPQNLRHLSKTARLSVRDFRKRFGEVCR